jgi:hypothetical protein
MKIAHRVLLLLVTMGSPAFGAPLTPRELQDALGSRPQGSEDDRLAERMRDYFGKENVLRWRKPWRSPAATTRSYTATDSTAIATAERSCPILSAGYGAITSQRHSIE